ncbi:hypothetical protein V8F06_006242 [Rhypophila decipiens]
MPRSNHPLLSNPWKPSMHPDMYLDGPGFRPVDSYGRPLECYTQFGSCTEEDPAIYYGYPFRAGDAFFRLPEQRQWIEKELQEVCKVAGLKCMVIRREPHHHIARRDANGYQVWEFDRDEWKWKQAKDNDRWHASVLLGTEFKKCLLQGHVYCRKIFGRTNGATGTPLKRINHPEFGRVPPGPVPRDQIPLIEIVQGQDYWDPDDPWCMEFWLTPGTEVVAVRPADKEPAQPPSAVPEPGLAPAERGFAPPPPPPGLAPDVWQPVVAPWYPSQPPPGQQQPAAQYPQNPEQPHSSSKLNSLSGSCNISNMDNKDWNTQQQQYLQMQQQMHQLQAAQQQTFVDPFANPQPTVTTTVVQPPQWNYDTAMRLWISPDQTQAQHHETGIEYEIVDRKCYTNFKGRRLEYNPVFAVHRDVLTSKCYSASAVNGITTFADAFKPPGAFGEP